MAMSGTNVLVELLESNSLIHKDKLKQLGVQVGKLYTDHGFPIDMSLDRLNIGIAAKLAVLDGSCQWLIEHKRRSGATEKAINRQRKANLEMVTRFIETGETGVY